MAVAQVPLVLVSQNVKPDEQDQTGRSDNLAPRRDYVEIARRLGGDLVGYDLFDTAWYRWARRMEQRLKLDFIESLSAVRQFSKHDVVLSTSEKVAIPLAALSQMMRREVPQVVIAHKLSSGSKTRLWKTWQLHRAFAQVICVCRAQADYAVHQLGLAPSQVSFIYDSVDHLFFRPSKIETEPFILAVGQEQRDYTTLLQAVSGTGLKLVVVASSPWSSSRVDISEADHVTVLSHISYQALRDLYARARLIIVPLLNMDYSAGSNGVLEAMAMGKPVIVSHTRGITDYVTHGENGLYVSPGEPQELRETIRSLWEQPAERDRLGANARQAVQDKMNVDIYADRVVQIVRQAIAAPKVRA
jgi:glycosyltransferase involved in cell wall biosynthesis